MTITIDLTDLTVLAALAATLMVAISLALFFLFPALALLALRANDELINSFLSWLDRKGSWIYAAISALCTVAVAACVYGSPVTPETQAHVDTFFRHLLVNSGWFAVYITAIRLHDYYYTTQVS